MSLIWFDTETYSDVPISYGTNRYALGAEVIMWQWAVDDGPVKVENEYTSELDDLLCNAGNTIVTHNSYFDRTVLRLSENIDIPVERWHDTMVQALMHGLPGSLDQLSKIFKLGDASKKDGSKLIHLFCKPRPKNHKLRRATKETHPKEWAEFREYGKADVEAMRELYKRMPNWNYKGDELALWHLDQRINDRGVYMDLELADAALTTIAAEQKHMAARVSTLTGGAVGSATQRDKLIAHIASEYGLTLPDLQTGNVESLLDAGGLAPEVAELLSLRVDTARSSTAKYVRAVNCTSPDGRLRGSLQFCGAMRTGRWGGRLIQFQNLPRPVFGAGHIETGIAAVKAGVADLIDDKVMALCSSALRGLVVAPAGTKLVVADLSNIEGRVLAWLAGESWKLQAFRDFDTILGYDAKNEPLRAGPDLYALAYAKSFGVTPESVMADKKAGGNQRQVGKTMELALGFAGGVGAFVTFAAVYDIDLETLAGALDLMPAETVEEARGFLEWTRKQKRPDFGLSDRAFMACEGIKRLWRAAHPNTVALWAGLETATRNAVIHPGNTFACARVKCRVDGAWLRIQLPSGRALVYAAPKLDEDGLSYMGVDQYTRQWRRLRTFGGKICENLTQATARDVMAANMPHIDKTGYQIVLSVHDELLTETPDNEWFGPGALSAMMATPPKWALDLPLAAAGFESYRYRKE